MNFSYFHQDKDWMKKEDQEAYSCGWICKVKIVDATTVAVIAVFVDDIQKLLRQDTHHGEKG